MSSRFRVLATSAIVLLVTASQVQACFWPFCCHGGGYGGGYAWGGPVGYGRTVGYRRGFYAGYYAGTGGCSSCGTCSSCGYGGCSSCGVTSYYAPSCCSSCGVVGCSSCGVSYGCSSCGTGCSNCTNYYPDSSDSESTSTYSDPVESTDPTDANPRDDDFGPNSRSTDETGDGDSIPDNAEDEFESPFNPAPGEPTNGEEPPMAAPLRISPQLTWQVMPTRSRVHVEADIRTPRVARVDAAPNAVPNLSALRVASFEN